MLSELLMLHELSITPRTLKLLKALHIHYKSLFTMIRRCIRIFELLPLIPCGKAQHSFITCIVISQQSFPPVNEPSKFRINKTQIVTYLFGRVNRMLVGNTLMQFVCFFPSKLAEQRCKILLMMVLVRYNLAKPEKPSLSQHILNCMDSSSFANSNIRYRLGFFISSCFTPPVFAE